jgi:LPS-assembly lipoprotein
MYWVVRQVIMGFKLKWVIAPCAVFILLSGCTDIRPLYGTNGMTYSESVSGQLADIDIPEPKTRTEQLVRNDLISGMSPAGTQGGGRYTLTLTVSERLSSAYIAPNSEISRKLLQLNANYVLTEQKGGLAIHSGKTFSEVSYDRITSEFANMQAKTDARERAAGEIARDIRIRLAAFFSSRENSDVAMK